MTLIILYSVRSALKEEILIVCRSKIYHNCYISPVFNIKHTEGNKFNKFGYLPLKSLMAIFTFSFQPA